MERIIDLHMHTTCSDGALSPLEIVDEAKKNGVSTIAIADHDNTADYTDELFEYAKKMKKAHDNYECALAEDNKSLIESADFEMQQAFPMMFISMVGLEEEELRRLLCEYAIAYSSLIRKENSNVKEETISFATNCGSLVEL